MPQQVQQPPTVYAVPQQLQPQPAFPVAQPIYAAPQPQQPQQP